MKSVLRLVSHGDVGVGEQELANVSEAELEALKALKGKATAEQGLLVVVVILGKSREIEGREG